MKIMQIESGYFMYMLRGLASGQTLTYNPKDVKKGRNSYFHYNGKNIQGRVPGYLLELGFIEPQGTFETGFTYTLTEAGQDFLTHESDPTYLPLLIREGKLYSWSVDQKGVYVKETIEIFGDDYFFLWKTKHEYFAGHDQLLKISAEEARNWALQMLRENKKPLHREVYGSGRFEYHFGLEDVLLPEDFKIVEQQFLTEKGEFEKVVYDRVKQELQLREGYEKDPTLARVVRRLMVQEVELETLRVRALAAKA
jgi:hypothetical protein